MLYPMKSAQLMESINDERYSQKPYKNFGSVEMTTNTKLDTSVKEEVAAEVSKCVKGKGIFEEEKELQWKTSRYKTHSDDATLTQQINLLSRAIPENTQGVASSSESTKHIIARNVKETYTEIFKKNLINFLKSMHNGWSGLGAYTKK